jgi:hypothetical protein
LGAVFIHDREGVENDTDIDVSIIGGWPETGFLARYFLRSEEVGKKPGFFDSTRGEKPGFCEILRYIAKIWEKTRFL